LSIVGELAQPSMSQRAGAAEYVTNYEQNFNMSKQKNFLSEL